MTRKLFGTDGIRGTANSDPMTADMALKVGMAAGAQFIRGDHRHRVVIGKDTRLSGYLLEPALVAGFVSVGMDVIIVGPIPTPAIAMLTQSLRADLGVMLSASHNPYHDNGIKLFGPDGYKLSDAIEIEIEARMAGDQSADLASSDKLGRTWRLDSARGRYNDYVKRTFPREHTLDGLKVVLDCANGAAYRVAPEVLWELGADVVAIGVDPDGFNINKDCGSTNTDALQALTLAHGADLGIALDGDADRVLVCDEKGDLVDGDQILGLVARNWRERGILKGGGVVATVMSNLGLERFLNDELGLGLERTQVGDRYVVEYMRAKGFNLGGEQSGHIILGDYSTTGDGLIAALQVLSVVKKSGLPASEVCRPFEPLPQLLKNVRFDGASPLEAAVVQDAIADAQALLKDKGRLLVRPSGTEPLVRVMAEGEDDILITRVVDELITVLETEVRT